MIKTGKISGKRDWKITTITDKKNRKFVGGKGRDTKQLDANRSIIKCHGCCNHVSELHPEERQQNGNFICRYEEHNADRDDRKYPSQYIAARNVERFVRGWPTKGQVRAPIIRAWHNDVLRNLLGWHNYQGRQRYRCLTWKTDLVTQISITHALRGWLAFSHLCVPEAPLSKRMEKLFSIYR